jgi:hypothetical protein
MTDWPNHEFLENARIPASCMKCGYSRDATHHKQPYVGWVRKMGALINRIKKNPPKIYD